MTIQAWLSIISQVGILYEKKHTQISTLLMNCEYICTECVCLCVRVCVKDEPVCVGGLCGA